MSIPQDVNRSAGPPLFVLAVLMVWSAPVHAQNRRTLADEMEHALRTQLL